MATNVRDLFDQIVQDNLLEDRREYSEGMLARMYSLSSTEAEDLYYLIQREFDPTLKDKLEDIPAEVFKEYFLEAQHGSWDGWDEEHIRLAFDRLLDDLRLYALNR